MDAMAIHGCPRMTWVPIIFMGFHDDHGYSGMSVDFPSACSGGAAVIPSLSSVGLPTLSSSYDVTLSGAIPSAFAVMVSGLSDTVHNGLPLPAPLPGAPGCSIFVAPDVTQLFTTNAAGAASAPFSIPASPGYIGLSLFHQWAVLDPINALGIVVSDAGKATIDT